MTAKLDERFNQTSEALNQYKIDLRKSIGNIMSPLLWLPLKNSLDMITGTGSVTFSRASTATYIDRYGVLQYASIDEPRFEKEGLLIEGPSTNLLLYSENFSNSVWVKASGLTVTSNTSEVTAPDGSNNADIIDDTDNTQYQSIDQVVSISNDDSIYTFSVFVKKKTSNICLIQINLDGGTSKYSSILVNLDNGDIALRTDLPGPNNPYDYKVKYIKDGWYRISVSIQNNSTGNTSLMTIISPAVSDMSGDYDSEATGSIYVWGAQLEKLPFASSYIPTTDSAVTRAVDLCTVDFENNIPPANTDPFTVVLDYDIIGSDLGRSQIMFSVENEEKREFGIHDGIYMYYGYDNYIITDKMKPYGRICYLYDLLSYKLYYNNIKIADHSAAAMQVGNLENSEISIYIGNHVDTVYSLFGHISNFRIYDKALTDEEIALL